MKKLTEPLSFAELMAPAEKKVDYIAPSFLPKSSKILMGSLAKCGKSFVSMEIARALATGTPLFGSSRFQVSTPCKVLLCDKELGARTLGERLKGFFSAAGPEEMELAGKNLVAISGNASFKFDAYECRKPIEGYLDRILPNVMILDPVTKYMQNSDSDNEHVKNFLEFLDVLIEKFRERTQLSIICLHHFKKPAVDFRGQVIDPGNMYNFRGASKWPDDMDSIITMQRHDVNSSHWRLECEPEFRHGASPDTFWLDIKPEATIPVLETVSPLAAQPLKRKLLA